LLARQKKSPFDIAFQALQTKWACEKHNGYCYLDPSGPKELHIQFTPLEWGIWATAIKNGNSVPDYPPRTKAFDQIILQHRINSRSKSKKKPNHYDNSDDEHNSHKAIKIINMTQQPYPDFRPHHPHPDFLRPPSYSRRYSDPSTSPRKAPASVKIDVVESLKAIGYVPRDWVDKGLEDYFNWLNDEFKGLNFQKALEAVKKQDIGLDTLGMDRVDVKFLTTTCGISGGNALRILDGFRRWLDVKLSATAYE
jgi:hypothetical protein